MLSKILISLCLFLNINVSGDILKISSNNIIKAKITENKSFWTPTKKGYNDWCIEGTVWREYSDFRRGSLVQVLINKKIKINEKEFKISQVLECNN